MNFIYLKVEITDLKNNIRKQMVNKLNSIFIKQYHIFFNKNYYCTIKRRTGIMNFKQTTKFLLSRKGDITVTNDRND